MKVLIIEDGTEYSDTFRRFLREGFHWTRAGTGAEALERLKREPFQVVFCDMRFDRIDPADLLGNVEEVAEQFNGDRTLATEHLQNYQGNYILSALRAEGLAVPVLLSYDFQDEPRRWKHILQRYAPVDYLPDQSSPTEVGVRIIALGTSAR